MRQAILLSAAILGYVLLTQYGRRRLSWRGWLSAVIGIPVAAAIYLARAPGHLDDVYLYLASAAVGIGFGTLASLATGVERDRETGQLYTRCGAAFAVAWTAALGTRVAFIWALRDVPWFAGTAGPFIRDHQIGRDAIAAAFVLMAVTMYGLRFAVIALRARRLPVQARRAGQAGGRGAPPAEPASAAGPGST